MQHYQKDDIVKPSILKTRIKIFKLIQRAKKDVFTKHIWQNIPIFDEFENRYTMKEIDIIINN